MSQPGRDCSPNGWRAVAETNLTGTWNMTEELTEVVYSAGGLSLDGDPMDEREQQRKIRHRLAILRHAEEVTQDVSATCRYYGISRPTF